MTRRLLLALAFLIAPCVSQAQDVTAPVWAKPDNFWFRKTLPDGATVWLTVDGVYGVKAPLFDHQRLATELGVRTGSTFDPRKLPFADPASQFVVKYDGSSIPIDHGLLAVEFVMDGAHWRCDLQVEWDWAKVPPTDYECTRGDPVVQGARATAAADDAAKRSPDGKWEAFIRDYNVAVRPAGAMTPVRMLSSDGTRTFAYQAGSIEWSDDSTAVTAYRVNDQLFTENTVTGNVSSHVVSGQWTVPD